jgi:hypothetical protein
MPSALASPAQFWVQPVRGDTLAPQARFAARAAQAWWL